MPDIHTQSPRSFGAKSAVRAGFVSSAVLAILFFCWFAAQPADVLVESGDQDFTATIEGSAPPFAVRKVVVSRDGQLAIFTLRRIESWWLHFRLKLGSSPLRATSIGGPSSSLLEVVEPAELQAGELEKLEAQKSQLGVSSATWIRIANAVAVEAILLHDLPTSHVPLRALFGMPVNSWQLVGVDTETRAHVFDASFQPLPHGLSFVYAGKSGWSMRVRAGPNDISLFPVNTNNYIRVIRRFGNFPPEATADQYVPLRRNFDTAGAPPDGKSKVQGKAAITLTVGVTPSAIRRILDFDGRRPEGVQSDLRAITEAIARQISEDNRFVFGAHEGSRTFQLAGSAVEVDFPEGVSGPSSLSTLCSAKTSASLPGAARLARQMRIDRGDIGILVVDKVCLDRSGRVDDPISCDTEAKPISCDSLPQPRNICGLATSIGSQPSTAFAIVNASCLSQATLHHEVGHLLGAQHATGESPGAPTARAYLGVDPHSNAHWITLVGSFEDCPPVQGDENPCYRIPVFSDPSRSIRRADRPGVEQWLLGSAERDNWSEISRNFGIVAQFGETRTASYCSAPRELGTIRFRFNAPLLGAWDVLATSLSSELDLNHLQRAREEAREFLEACKDGVLRFEGHADRVPGPTPDYNQSLSYARARDVRAAVLDAIPLPSAMRLCEPIGFGANFPETEYPLSGTTLNRRVVISTAPARCAD